MRVEDRLLRIKWNCYGNVMLKITKHHKDYQKAWKIIGIINEQLGGVDLTQEESTIYIAISKYRTIGVMVMINVAFGYPAIIEDTIGYSNTPQPVIAGVSRIWVVEKFRRRGIARQLLDYGRKTFMNRELEKHEIAFSHPTSFGIKLAQNYFNGNEILIF